MYFLNVLNKQEKYVERHLDFKIILFSILVGFFFFVTVYLSLSRAPVKSVP